MVKNYVLDTNVLIHDPEAIYSFEDNNVFVPLPVIEELDKLKKEQGRVGRSARAAIRVLEELRNRGNLHDGVKLNNGGRLIIPVLSESDFDRHQVKFLFEKYVDNWILSYAMFLRTTRTEPTIIVSKDISLRLKALAIGLDAEDYLTDKSDLSMLPVGYISADSLSKLNIPGLYVNEYIECNEGYFRFDGQDFVEINSKMKIFGITPRNKEQLFALDALINDELKLVSLIGIAGTGKTFLALAAALEKTLVEGVYERVIVARPLIPMGGKDIGYLPGALEEKISPWMSGVMDNLEYLCRLNSVSLKDLMKKEIIELEALTYIRGRSIPKQFIIIDEAQNLTPLEVKTILTRAGEGTKVVLTGDPYQIDTPYLDESSNGLVYAASRFLGKPIAAHVFLKKGERSELASLAAELL
ncbi:PhoH-like ATPase [Fervidobacterium changbaicum]|uniref:PhoH family protein n=1 Tax=Fervidobacterium changbaicum TaxID=310769 RepID=A0ABX5QR35_9BACT|nr:PhoH family protein [Fervidobacterium changbaicum]QAV32778.1 PhoH family protein [Fervidobacterium changbaicum]SDG95861.1 PhoH-like ATPase [Fervidobacterium changbaicum]